MQVRTTDITAADKLSATVFFNSLSQLFNLSDAYVLDAFARNGQLTVSAYKNLVNRTGITCWELGAEHEAALMKLSNDVHIGCSYQMAQEDHDNGIVFDMIVIDTPQGLHNDCYGVAHAEHFDFLEAACKLIDQEGILVLYVNKKPYNKEEVGSYGYDEYAEYNFNAWMTTRTTFYGQANITEEQAIAAYRKHLFFQGFVIKSVIATPCISDVPGMPAYAFRLGLAIERIARIARVAHHPV